jgi:hypothetical protein
MARVLAPSCPDCGQPCQHPLTMPCEGTGLHDPLFPNRGPCNAKDGCHGTGKVTPPPPTDEQIFGRECGLCHGKGKVGVWEPGSHNEEPDVLFGCGECSGAGRIGAAENRWTCPGGARLLVHDCDGTPDNPACLCPGRTDVLALPEAWEAFVRQLRTRTKTTVLLDGHVSYGREPYAWRLRGPGDMETQGISLYNLMPDGTQNLKGKRTITVTFEPEDEK